MQVRLNVDSVTTLTDSESSLNEGFVILIQTETFWMSH